MASPTPGYCTLTATARSSPVAGSTTTARCTWPIDAAAIGSGSHSTNSSSGGRAELALDDLGGELGATSAGPFACSAASAWRTGSGSPSSR